jgi:putative peptidoglycan lipid II flippase
MGRSTLSNRQIARAALVVVFGFLASGVLGLIRTALFSISFGGSVELDAYYAAQRIPETVYVLVAGGALGSSFIPIFARFWAKDDTSGAWRLASAVMTLASLIGLALTLIIWLAAPWLVPNLLVPGATPEVAALTTNLTQIMLLTVALFTVSGLIMGILNARQVFFLPSLALVMNNVGQIIGVLFFTQLLPEDQRIYGLAYGAVFGAALHLIVQLPGLRQVGARLTFLPSWRVEGTRDVLFLMLPRVLGLAVIQFNFIVNVILTSAMLPGSRTAIVTAWTLMFFVLGVIGQSIGTAVFPSLSALAAAGDMEGFKDRLANAMRGVLFLAFPATVGLITLGTVGIRLMFEHGEWTAQQTDATAWALAFFALGVAGHSLLEVLARTFYALSDTVTPVAVGIALMVVNIILSLLLIRVIGDPNDLARGPFAGLALANSLTTLIEAGILWWLLRRKIGAIRDGYVLRGAFGALLAALGMGLAIWLSQQILADQPTIVAAAVGFLLGAAVFFVLALVLRVEEARTIPNMVLARVKR